MLYRRYPISCTENTRDLGGYPTKDGGVTRFGMFVRSDAWVDAPESDIAFIRKIGVRTVVDLRTKEQAAKAPHSLCAENGFNYINVSVLGGAKIPDTLEEYPITYMEMMGGSEYVRDVFKAFAANDEPILFNCSAGKDRTGVIAGLLLEICGVADVAILAEYTLSAEYMHDNIIHNAPIENFDPGVVTPNRITWEKFLSMFREEYGNARNYLIGAGVAEDEIDTIVRRFVQYD